MTTADQCEYSFGRSQCTQQARFTGISLSTKERKRVCASHAHFLEAPEEIK